jgi:hypothetical protein
VRREILCAHKRLDSLVHAMEAVYAHKENKFACDAKMVARTVEITCSKWITHTVMLCAQYACARSCIVLLPLL